MCGMVLEHHHHDADGSLCIGLCLDGHHCDGHGHHHPHDCGDDNSGCSCSMHIDTPYCHDINQWYAAIAMPVMAILTETVAVASPAPLRLPDCECKPVPLTVAAPDAAPAWRRGPPVC